MTILETWGSSQFKQNLDFVILKEVKSQVSGEAFEVLSTQINKSKRIRSLFLQLLTEEILEKNDLLTISLAIELFHQSTLILDDIIDNSVYREGDRQVLHKKLGNGIKEIGIAQHMAEILIILANKKLLEFGNLEIAKNFENTKLDMINAQLKDVGFTKKNINQTWLDFLQEESYQKTYSFLQFPFKVSNILNAKNKYNLEISKQIGILYQIGDDLEDIKTGLQPGTLSLTYPLCYLLDNTNILTNKEQDFIFSLMETMNMNQEQADNLTNIFRKYQNLFYDEVNKKLKNIGTKIDNINDEKIKQLSKEVLSLIFSDNYWNYNFLGT